MYLGVVIDKSKILTLAFGIFVFCTAYHLDSIYPHSQKSRGFPVGLYCRQFSSSRAKTTFFEISLIVSGSSVPRYLTMLCLPTV